MNDASIDSASGLARSNHAPSDTAGPARVYICEDAITLNRPPEDRHDRAPESQLVSGASEALQRLSDVRCEVIMLRDAGDEPLTGIGIAVRYAHSVAVADRPTWVITGDPGWCERERLTGVRTILVGPRRPPGPRPTTHCDIEARDLSAAVMEILAHEAMI
ncbi:MAG TPA: hypothetical protein VIV06_02130, partial [Candidatus Limnocylindrales bacterium]